MYKIAEPRIIQCPFNRYHVVSSLRIQKHIIKCQKNHPDVQFISCVYNFSHKIKPSEILDHYRACPYKVETYNFYTEESSDEDNEMENPKTIRYLSENTETNISGWDSTLSLSSLESINSKFETIFDSDTSFINDDEVEELKPLPLPEIPSKAFTFRKTNEKKVEKSFQQPNLSKTDSLSSLSLESSWNKYRRRKNNLIKDTPGPSRKTDHLFHQFSEDDRYSSRKFNQEESNSSFSSYSELEDYQATGSGETSDSSNADSFSHDLKSYVKIK